MPNYNYWQSALAGEKPKMFVDSPELGFYRKGVYERDAKGNNRRVGWAPVAIFMDGETMVARIGSEKLGRDVSGDDLNELWSYCAGNAISEGNYREVAERGNPWWDNPAPPEVHVPGMVSNREPREITSSDNNPPEVLTDKDHAAAIDSAIGAANGLKVTTIEEAAIAAGAANVIRDRRLAAEKVAKAKVGPLKVAYDTEREKWASPINRAKTKEDEVRLLVSSFEATERRRIAAEQLAALEKQREIDEANARAADRSIAAGEPETPPVVEEVVIPQAAPRVQPTYGSYKPREKPIQKFAVINEPLEVCKYFLADPAMVEVIQKLATNAIRAGLSVPGASYREGLV